MKTTVFVSFCQVEKDIKMKVNNNEQRGINKKVYCQNYNFLIWFINTSNDKGIFKN
ncbi:hypothetical protein ACYT4E_09175 [Lactococcus lactis]|uniref:hypothetical protein n=1 Tax=Lactococcus lactis TaxID=1358 RepID=UPI0022E805C5|nr:hypothetical protein [Lactococcus lactis]MDA2884832.1 hypothetical protein [Lactococcus lactis]MDA2887336.1 hypothetical protein [Lactococcus lactis]